MIIERLERRWQSGEILAARVNGEAIFPMEIRLRHPNPREVAEQFGEVSDWARELALASSEARSGGFELRRETRSNRVQGANALPVSAIIPTEKDALELIGKRRPAVRFQALADETLVRHPVLRDWLARRPHWALEHAAQWGRVLAVLDWFVAHPRPALYLRQLDIPSVDTKFIESHRKLLGELLDIILPESAVDRSAMGVKAFSRRYGLRTEAPLVRFRFLDPALYVQGRFSDVSLLPEEFAGLKTATERAFITENRVNGLAFPNCPGAMVVFGLGYGLERLSEIPWLREIDLHYWGDIDTHGFGMLNRLRTSLPHAQSFLMDRETLEAHSRLWGREPAGGRFNGDISRLTQAEARLYEDLFSDRLGERVRLEQERVSYGWLQRMLESRNGLGNGQK